MKYNININQYAAVALDMGLDIADMAIVDFLKDFSGSSHCLKKHVEGEGVFFWVSHKLIREELPLLGIRSDSGIKKRIQKLIDAEILEKCTMCDVMGKSLYRFGRNYDKLVFGASSFFDNPVPKVSGPRPESVGDPVPKVSGPRPESVGDNIYKDNNNKDYIDNDNSMLANETSFDATHTHDVQEDDTCINHQWSDAPGEKEKKSCAKKREKENAGGTRLTLFRDSDIYSLVEFDDNGVGVNYDRFEAQFSDPCFAGVDLVYYFHCVSDWSDAKNIKRTARGWLATIRNFIRGDVEKGKVRKKPSEEVSGDIAERMNFLNKFYNGDDFFAED